MTSDGKGARVCHESKTRRKVVRDHCTGVPNATQMPEEMSQLPVLERSCYNGDIFNLAPRGVDGCKLPPLSL